jgi:tRNA pseudouridine38-40 synthase
MVEAANLFKGEHDFKAYCASGSSVLTTVREIYEIKVEATKFECGFDVSISVCGGGFLYNMVRTMAGTILYYSLGRLTLEDISLSLSQGNRALVGKTMPSNGLILKDVDYGLDLFGSN